jgi:hypothetical protein
MGIGETREEVNFVFSGTFQDRCRASAWARSLADEFTLTPTSQLYSAKRIFCVAENRTFPFGVDKRAFSCIFLLDLGISLCQHATMRIALPRTLPSCLFLLCVFSATGTAQQLSIMRADYNYLSALGPHADPSQAEAAAQRLLQTPRPESISDGDWAVITAKAHKGLGWVDTTKRALPDAETEFEAALKLNPKDAEVSYWLGSAIKTRLQLSGISAGAKAAHSDQVKAEIGRALYHLARASVYDQEGCLDPQLRARLLEFCRQVYRNYGGKGDAGFEHLLDIVRSDPHPPAGFTIAALGSTK